MVLSINWPMTRQQGLLLILIFIALVGYGQIAPKHIRNYGPEVTRSGEVAQSVAIDMRGVPFLGTEQGVLVYEGDRWSIISLDDESAVRSLEFDSVRNRLWVGGVGTFGYITCDVSRPYRYVSISDDIIQQHPFKQAWQILIEKQKVTFMTNEGHYEWSDTGILWKDIKSTYVFSVDGTKYYSQRSGQLSIEENGKIVPVWDQHGIREAVYFMTALDSRNHLMFTPYNGVFRFDLKTRKVSPFASPLNTFLKEHAFYEATRINDSVLAIGTWFDGIILADVDGNIIDRCGTNKGMSSDGISDLQLDPFGKLWAATDYGISVIDLAAAWPDRFTSQRKSNVFPLQVTINSDSVIFFNCADASVVLQRHPQQLLFRFGAAGLDLPMTGKILARLQGHEEQWTPLAGLEKEYKQLTNGDFNLQLKLDDQHDDQLLASIAVRIAQPWYQPVADVWEYLILSSIIVSLFVFALTYRLRVSKRELKRMVDEKTRAIEKHERELLQMNAHLQQANEELDILLYRSSHDLISPVKSIKGLLNLIRLSPDEQTTYLSLMEDRIVRLEHILIELNSYVKNVKGELRLSPIPIRPLFDEVWRELEFIETAVKINLKLQVDDQLVFDCDRGRLKMIIGNLVANSVKYADLRKAEPFISIEVTIDEGRLVLRISDNGQGIRPEHKARLFEMFFRASEGSDGIGLGLFLVKKIVDSLKGSIVIESEFGQWTSVVVKLPDLKAPLR